MSSSLHEFQPLTDIQPLGKHRPPELPAAFAHRAAASREMEGEARAATSSLCFSTEVSNGATILRIALPAGASLRARAQWDFSTLVTSDCYWYFSSVAVLGRGFFVCLGGGCLVGWFGDFCCVFGFVLVLLVFCELLFFHLHLLIFAYWWKGIGETTGVVTHLRLRTPLTCLKPRHTPPSTNSLTFRKEGRRPG